MVKTRVNEYTRNKKDEADNMIIAPHKIYSIFNSLF